MARAIKRVADLCSKRRNYSDNIAKAITARPRRWVPAYSVRRSMDVGRDRISRTNRVSATTETGERVSFKKDIGRDRYRSAGQRRMR